MDATNATVWLRPEFEGRNTELIHLADGAALVGVTRAAVSNWAKRHHKFPKIVMLSGPPARRNKWVARDEFLDFARAQLGKPREYHGPKSPKRPRVQILTERITHWEAQVPRLEALEARHAAALQRTRKELRNARTKLQGAREQLAAEVAAVDSVKGQR